MALANERPGDFLLNASIVEIKDESACDPLSWFQSSQTFGSRWFWENPNEDSSWVGIGNACTHSVHGPNRFADAADFAKKLFNDLSVDCLLYTSDAADE